MKSHHNIEIVFDPTFPDVGKQAFARKDWSTSEFGNVERDKQLPVNWLKERGFGFVIGVKVDANNATDTVTRRSRSSLWCTWTVH